MHRCLPLIALVACVKAAPPSMHPAEVLSVATEDGWALDLRHYPGEGAPVLLVHGMGANHYNWDYTEEVSLASALSERGWDVWVPELRGDPGSVAPSRRDRRNFSFDDHAFYDLPAHVDRVLAESAASQLYWVGHSMGGILLYTAARDYPDKLAGGVAICSPVTLEYPNGVHKLARGFGWTVGGRGLLRSSGLARALAWMGPALPVWGVVGNKKNMDWDIGKGLAKHALVDLPRPMAKQAVGWMRSRQLGEVDGTPWIPESSAVPVLILGGAVDRIVPVANVAPACGIFSDCTFRVLGVEGGFEVDYGHIDPVLTRQGASEVFPVIVDWLEGRR